MIADGFDRNVLATNPDLVLWVLSPLDLSRSDWGVKQSPTIGMSQWAKIRHYFSLSLEQHSLMTAGSEMLDHAMSAKLLKILLYRNPGLYVKASVLRDSEETSYLKSQPSADLLGNVNEFSHSVSEIEQKSKAAGIPVVVAFLPDRTQVSMLVMGDAWPVGFDPYKLSKTLQPIVASHGMTYIDLLRDYYTVPNPQLGYFVIDGHPNGRGHAIFTEFLSQHLTDGTVPALARNARTQEGNRP